MAKHEYSTEQQSFGNTLQIPCCTTKKHTLQGVVAIDGLWVAYAMNACKSGYCPQNLTKVYQTVVTRDG